MKIPPKLLNRFLVFNCNAGFKPQVSQSGYVLSKPKRKSLRISADGELNDVAAERYELMLNTWYKQGKSFINSLDIEIRKIVRVGA